MKRTIGINRLDVPAIDGLVAPWTDTGHDHEVEVSNVFGGGRLQKSQRALDAAGLVAVDPTGDENEHD